MKGMVSASMMCADFLDLKKVLSELERADLDALHFDIMDGDFVCNYALGPCVIAPIRDSVRLPFDFHFMVNRPEDKMKYFNIRKGDYVSVHWEATSNLQRILGELRVKGIHAGVALNPGTPVSVLEDVLEDMDFLLLMTVNPGFAGQHLIPHSIEKIAKAREFLVSRGFGHIRIQVDGNVNVQNAGRMRKAGADFFVVGSSGLFMKRMSIIEAAEKLKQVIYPGEERQ